MVAFVMFWAALFAMCFFIAGTLFKALVSAIQALLNFAVRLVLFIIFFMAAVLGIMISVIEKVSHIVSFVLEGLAAICEKGYAKSLNSIIKRIDKC